MSYDNKERLGFVVLIHSKFSDYFSKVKCVLPLSEARGKLCYVERFKTRNTDTNSYDYFIALRYVIAVGVTMSYRQVKSELELNLSSIVSLL